MGSVNHKLVTLLGTLGVSGMVCAAGVAGGLSVKRIRHPDQHKHNNFHYGAPTEGQELC